MKSTMQQMNKEGLTLRDMVRQTKVTRHILTKVLFLPRSCTDRGGSVTCVPRQHRSLGTKRKHSPVRPSPPSKLASWESFHTGRTPRVAEAGARTHHSWPRKADIAAYTAASSPVPVAISWISANHHPECRDANKKGTVWV